MFRSATILYLLVLSTANTQHVFSQSNSVQGSSSQRASEEKQSELVTIAAVQVSGHDKTDFPSRDSWPTSKMMPYIERAAEAGAELIVFPEYFLGHILVPGTQTNAIAEAARKAQIYVVVGCWEDCGNDNYANTALVFGRDGTIVGRYRKTHAAVDQYQGSPAWRHPPAEKSPGWFKTNDPEWTMLRGTEFPVFDLDFGRIGILTCYDGWFPESFRVLSLSGAEVLIWINSRKGVVEDFIVKSVMFQSHVAMVTTNQAYGGGTMIGRPPAKILASAPNREESLILADIDMAALRRQRSHSRNFQQRRPDLYSPLAAGAEHIQPTAAATAKHLSQVQDVEGPDKQEPNR